MMKIPAADNGRCKCAATPVLNALERGMAEGYSGFRLLAWRQMLGRKQR
jgi:hypothetical protein